MRGPVGLVERVSVSGLSAPHAGILGVDVTYLREEDAPPFLRGGGVMGQAIRSFDWTQSPLGHPDHWPSELRTAVGLMLDAEMPVYIAFGPELISLYNDGYLPIVGKKHPGSLGQPFQILWAEIWAEYQPIVDQALRGHAQHYIDQPVALVGRPDRPLGYFTFSWTALRDDQGRPTGLYCTSVETTDRILAERSRVEAVERMDLALSVGNGIGSWDWDVIADLVTADHRFADLYGVDRMLAAKGAPIAEFFANIHPDDLPSLQASIGRTVAEGVPFAAEYRLLNRDGSVRWVAAQGAAILDADGRCVRFPGVTFDITTRMQAQLDLRSAVETREFVINLTALQRALDDPEAILAATTRALGAMLGADRCCIIRQTGSGTVVHGPCWTSGRLPDVTGTLGPTRFGERVRQARDDADELHFSDPAQIDGGGLQELIDEGVGGGIFMPLLQGGAPMGSLVVHCAAPRDWTPAEISLVREVGGLTMLAIDRASALGLMQQRLGSQQHTLELQAAERAAIERQLVQLQKVEAMGQLTSGIAHDFNNMITVITSGLNLIKRALENDDPDLDAHIAATIDGAHRASALTRRLMAFARQSDLAPEPVDAGALIASLTDLLRRTLGAGITLKTEIGATPWTLTADRSQLESVIVNLAVNARDAMPDGGTLTLAVGNGFVDQADAALSAIRPGQYVVISVTDTGTGMTPEVAERAFDPFFTTKEVGKGTGLGLAQAMRFARQLGGHASIASTEGTGTTISLYLPRWTGQLPQARPAAAQRAAASAGREGGPTTAR